MIHEASVKVSKDQERGTRCDILVHNSYAATSFTPIFPSWRDKTGRLPRNHVKSLNLRLFKK